MIVALVLAIFFHSNLNRSLFGDLAWAFTQYLETFAILSQFILFSKKVSSFFINLLGRRDLNLHFSLHRSPGYFANPVDYLLD